jgi:hypothetical protein
LATNYAEHQPKQVRAKECERSKCPGYRRAQDDKNNLLRHNRVRRNGKKEKECGAGGCGAKRMNSGLGAVPVWGGAGKHFHYVSHFSFQKPGSRTKRYGVGTARS